jgi:DNA-binding XRE family transcriptional regulator
MYSQGGSDAGADQKRPTVGYSPRSCPCQSTPRSQPAGGLATSSPQVPDSVLHLRGCLPGVLRGAAFANILPGHEHIIDDRLCYGCPLFLSITGGARPPPRLRAANQRPSTALGLSQEQLAERAGLHWTYVSGIERGRRNPGLNTLASLARGLKVPLSELLGEIDR